MMPATESRGAQLVVAGARRLDRRGSAVVTITKLASAACRACSMCGRERKPSTMLEAAMKSASSRSSVKPNHRPARAPPQRHTHDARFAAGDDARGAFRKSIACEANSCRRAARAEQIAHV
jgi:hypothetical protein